MGLLSWIFPSAEDRVARARKMMDNQRWADARLEVMDLDHPDAVAIVTDCEARLARLNLDAAVSWAHAGDEDRVRHHLEVAANFHQGGLEGDFKATRRQLRELRAEREAEARRKAEELQARQHADPLGMSGGPKWLDPNTPSDLLDADDEEAAARLALIVENYDSSLRTRVEGLGAPFARALLDLEDGRADLAVQNLLTLPDDNPLVAYERARAAYSLGDAGAAARQLRTFAKLTGEHVGMGKHHTGEFLAQCLAESGDPNGALRVLRDVRARQPKVGGPLFASLLEATGALEEAETTVRGLLRDHPRETFLYRMLARIRVGGGHRVQAMQALEQGLTACECVPGRCGSRPPDPAVYRDLAMLYFEDGIEPERARSLAQEAARLTKQPQWEDAYLAALVAKADAHPDAGRLAGAIWEHTPDGDPRVDRLTRFLPAPV